MKSPREVLVNLCYENDETEKKTKKLIDQALSDLSEIVMGEKKEQIALVDNANEIRGYMKPAEVAIYNQAIDHIAKLFEAKEKGYPCADCGKMRTKSEGGTTFTVCDECWEKHFKAKD